MHDKRRASVPAADEGEKIGHMLLARAGHPVHRRRDIVDGEVQMIFRRDARRAGDRRLMIDQRHDMPGTGLSDRLGEAGQRTHDNRAHAASAVIIFDTDLKPLRNADSAFFAGQGSSIGEISARPILPGRPKKRAASLSAKPASLTASQ